MRIKITCNRCNHTAIVQSSYVSTVDHKTLYCQCTNPQCGHSFVSTLSFSHTLSPSSMDIPESVLSKIQNMNREQQQTLFSVLAN